MKNLKFIMVIAALLVFPFLSKAQILGGGSLNLTVNYVDHGYGPLSCTAVTTGPGHSYPFTIVNGSSHTYSSNDAAWWGLDGISAGGITLPMITVSELEGHTIGVDYGYHYVPKSPSGTAPVFTIKRNSPYNYTITTWVIPL